MCLLIYLDGVLLLLITGKAALDFCKQVLMWTCVRARSLQSCLTLPPYGLYVALQPPLSMGSSRQEYWSGLPFPPPRDLPDPGIEQVSQVSCISRQVLYH